MVDVDDAAPLSSNEACEADAVGPGALDPEGFDGPALTSLDQQLRVAGLSGGRPDRGESSAQAVEA